MKVPYTILAGVVATMLASSAMAVTGPIMLTKGLGSVPPAPPPATISCTANLTIVPGGAGASTVVAASLSSGALGVALGGVCPRGRSGDHQRGAVHNDRRLLRTDQCGGELEWRFTNDHLRDHVDGARLPDQLAMGRPRRP